MKWYEERRYLNEKPSETKLKIVDVDLHIDEAHITGVGVLINGDVVIRYKRGDTLIYVFYKNDKEPVKSSDVSKLKSPDVLRRLIGGEEETVKKIKEPLREYADKVEKELSQFPVEIKITMWPARVYVKLLHRVDKETFQRYISTCRQLGMKYEPQSSAWVWELPF